MIKSRFLIPLIAAAMVLSSVPVHAGGWGPYFSWSRDIPKTGFPGLVQDEVIELVKQSGVPDELITLLENSMNDMELKFNQDHISFGVLYDSAPSRDKLFNFRMNLGVDFAVSGDVTDVSFPSTGYAWVDELALRGGDYVGSLLDSTGYGGTLQFTFGFAPIRTQLLKWWLGPTIRINGNYFPLDVSVPEFGNLKHGGTVALGGGIESGVNFHVTSFMSIGVTGGFLWNAYGLGAAVEDANQAVSDGTFFWGDGPMFLVQVSVLFHTGDDRTAWE